MAKRFGEILKEARGKRELTLRELGQIVDYKPSYLSEIENGTRRPPKDLTRLRDLAKALRTDFSELVAAARLDEVEHESGFLKKLFNVDRELAAGFCRAAETSSDEELKDAMTMALARLKTQNQRS